MLKKNAILYGVFFCVFLWNINQAVKYNVITRKQSKERNADFFKRGYMWTVLN